MKIMILSDTHGQIEHIYSTINKLKDVDLIIHLGDYCKDADKIKEKTGINVVNVRGNCDILDSITLEDRIIEIKEKKIFITHGHRYNVKYDLNNIYYKAKELQVNAVLFGHSHVPVLTVYDDIIFLNPGSATLPRGGSKRSYGLMEIGDNIDVRILNLE